MDLLKDKESCTSFNSKNKRDTNSGVKEAASLRDEGEKVGQKRKQDGNIAESNLDKNCKLAKEESAEPKTRPIDDFSIKMCISVLKTMEEFSCEERVECFEVFKDVQDREIFLCAEPAERILWLKKKIVSGKIFLQQVHVSFFFYRFFLVVCLTIFSFS